MPITTKIIGERYFNEIKTDGAGVPRNEDGYIIDTFVVSKEYIIKPKKGSVEQLRVRCTQDCPTHLRVIK